MGKTRSEKLIKSSFWGIAGYVAYTLIGFVSRSIFINKLGEDLTGVATLFATILNLLSLNELGFSNAIMLFLYKPVAENNYREISRLVNLYGKIYRVLAIAVLTIGLIMTPFVHLLITSDTTIEHLEFYFILYVLKSVAYYLFNYKTVLFSLYQEAHLGDIVFYGFLTLTTAAQAAVIYYTGNYGVYLILRVVGALCANVVRSAIAKKRYPFLENYKTENVDNVKIREIFSYIKLIAFDKGSVMLKTTTDTIFTSKLVNVAVTALVSNYNLIIVACTAVLNIIFTNASAGIGNMTVTESKKQQFTTYLDLSFVAFWIYGFICVGIACASTNFVTDLWLHNRRFGLPVITVVLLVSNMFFMGIEQPSENYFAALGLVEKFRYRNVINVVMNIVFSLVLVFPLGVNGVYLGTIISFLLSTFWLTPYVILKEHFDKRYRRYVKLQLHGIITNVVCLTACLYVCEKVTVGGIAETILQILLCTLVYNLIFILSFFKSTQFRNMYNLLKSIVVNTLKFRTERNNV